MIEALKKIGELVLKEEFNLSNLDEDFWENQAFRSIYLISEEAFNFDYFNNQVENELEKPYMIYILLETTEEISEAKYEGIELKEAFQKDNNKWIRKEAVGGVYYSPTIPVKISTKRANILKNVDKSIKTLIGTLKIKTKEKKYYLEEIYNYILKIFQTLKSNKSKINDEITDLIIKTFLEPSISQKKINIIISLKVNNQTLKENNYINKYLFHKFILKTFKTPDAFNQQGEVNWINSDESMRCALCSRENQNITTEYKPYTFYSKDKRSYNTNSNFSTSGNMFPIDIQCAYLVEIGKCYVDMNYEFKIGGYSFKLVPKILFPVSAEYEKKILDLRINYKKLMKKESRTNFVKQEDFLFSILEDFKNTVNFDMIFYEKNQAEFKILLHIKDVAPSRIKKIHDAFKESRKMGNTYRNYGNLISFYSIKRFFSRYEGSDIKFYDEEFLEMLDIIFSGKNIKKIHLLSSFYSNLKNKIFKSEKEPYQARETEIHAALLIFEVLKQLEILNW